MLRTGRRGDQQRLMAGAVQGVDVDVQRCHLRDGRAFERGHEPRHPAVLAGADDVISTHAR